MDNIINIARSIAGYEHKRVSRFDIQYNEEVGYLMLQAKDDVIKIYANGSFEVDL